MVSKYTFNYEIYMVSDTHLKHPLHFSSMIIWLFHNGPYLRASSTFIVNMQWWSFIILMVYGWRCASLFDSSLSLGCWVMMDLSTTSVLAAKAYKYKAESLVKEYLLADSYVSYTAVLGGILMCKMVWNSPSYLLILDIHDQPTFELICSHGSCV